MCIAIPGKIISIVDETTAIADIGGISRSIKLDLVGKADESFIGRYALIHAGYAISMISDNEAEQTLEIIEKLVNLS
ncbi:hydrogenase assembly chaperone hypC/hupF [Methanosalsum zhilinae DSM 4017]|uniref:Hydrogenase assembly chaperone hypC/hupF n=1 Tax=Methanosalsum zhilinae (strain DSM 4017 / NBRC 107636 / OCM 62 / WeN5) TaxID=679901 RepID=F7XLC1_METZD|nr:HypC/HybG/HupF family hydrogenase formation chaperone [Methanosalsum zhilinae]AEH60778.1 hydrogenase assembly chaperone hypC/hupF [Methanosalsum zhilinae DSM 4017]